MARKKPSNQGKRFSYKFSEERVSKKASSRSSGGIIERLQDDLQTNQSYLNLILGTLIVIVLGLLIFNYFNKPKSELGPSLQNANEEQASEDVKKEALPGKYTVKEGDTLFLIAQKYYNDGYQYQKIIEENKLPDENLISVGQVLDIPKIEIKSSVEASPSSSIVPGEIGQGGAINQTIWGERISGDTYTVQVDDWLSKIAGRAYGDPMAYQKIADANNISNADLIEVGMTLKIPR